MNTKTYRSALEEVISCAFKITDDEFFKRTLEAAYKELQQSRDPAVQYLIGRLAYLPEGSQPRNPDAVPEVEWLNDAKTNGIVQTPLGTGLGFIERYSDGGWGIQPYESGPVQVTDIAEKLVDAKHYLINRLTHQATVTVNGVSKQLRIVNEKNYFLASASDAAWTPPVDPNQLETYELEFWDGQHGLKVGDTIKAKLHRQDHEGAVSNLEGVVHAVTKQKMLVKGSDYYHFEGQ